MDSKTNIQELKEGETAEIRASLVQLFETGIFYEICPQCESRVVKEGKTFKCPEHGVVEPNKTIVLSGIIDDGTANIRAVFFRNVALDLIGMDIKQALEKEEDVDKQARMANLILVYMKILETIKKPSKINK